MSSIKKKLVLDRTIKYKTPCIITLSGLPGSGKTTCAKVLSRNLKIFIVCNDFVRGYFNCSSQELDEKSRKKVDRKVFLFNIKRLIELFLNRVSIVLDSDINNLAKFKKVELLAKIFRYQIINIKINSIDD